MTSIFQVFDYAQILKILLTDTENLTLFLFFWKFFWGMKKRIRERVGNAKGVGLSRMMRVGNLWLTRLRPCVDNVWVRAPQVWSQLWYLAGNWKREQRISRVISAYLCPICTSGRTWRIGRSQIWTRSRPVSVCGHFRKAKSWVTVVTGFVTLLY